MNSLIVMKTHPKHCLKNPTLDDVMDALSRKEQGHDWPECGIALEVLVPANSKAYKSLEIYSLFGEEMDSPLRGWILRYYDAASKTSRVLSKEPVDDARVSLFMFGAPESVRSDCILDRNSMRPAIRWFLEAVAMHPEPQWRDFLESVKSE